MNKTDNENYDLVIIGAGIAGMTAAIYASRAKLHLLVLEKFFPGGQAMLTHRVENYPGFSSISGSELVQNIQSQAEHFGSKITSEEVARILPGDTEHVVETEKSRYTTKNIIVASGAHPKTLNIPGEKECTGKGVSYCGTCDAAFFPDKDVAVVGGGDTAIEEALFIAKFAKTVTVIHRRDRLRAIKVLEEEARKNSKIRFLLESTVKEIQGKDAVESLVLENVKTGKTNTLNVDGVFIFVGYRPQSDFALCVDRDERGYIITDGNCETATKGIFAIGDVRNGPLKQMVTAAGDGATAAYTITKRITGYY